MNPTPSNIPPNPGACAHREEWGDHEAKIRAEDEPRRTMEDILFEAILEQLLDPYSEHKPPMLKN